MSFHRMPRTFASCFTMQRLDTFWTWRSCKCAVCHGWAGTRWRFSFVGSRGTSHLFGICRPLPVASEADLESCVDLLEVRQFTSWLCMVWRKIGVMTVVIISCYIYFVVRVYLVMLWLRFHDVPWLIAVHQKNSRLTIGTGAGWCTVLLNAGWT